MKDLNIGSICETWNQQLGAACSCAVPEDSCSSELDKSSGTLRLVLMCYSAWSVRTVNEVKSGQSSTQVRCIARRFPVRVYFARLVFSSRPIRCNRRGAPGPLATTKTSLPHKKKKIKDRGGILDNASEQKHTSWNASDCTCFPVPCLHSPRPPRCRSPTPVAPVMKFKCTIGGLVFDTRMTCAKDNYWGCMAKPVVHQQ